MENIFLERFKEKYIFLDFKDITEYFESIGLDVKSDCKKKLFDYVNTDEKAAHVMKAMPKAFGVMASYVEDTLGITTNERNKWTKKGFLTVVGTFEFKSHYGKMINARLYDFVEVSLLTPETIAVWRDKTKATPKQLEAINRAKEAYALKNTCDSCGNLYSPIGKNAISVVDGYKLCWSCQKRYRGYGNIKNVCEKWLQHKDLYVILDTETTGLGPDAEILEVAVLDLDGNVLFDSLVKPKGIIPEHVSNIHGITADTVIDAPTFAEIFLDLDAILNNRCFLAYNSDFDARMIDQTCSLYGIDHSIYHHVCVADAYKDSFSNKRYIKLENFSKTVQSHRALDDCKIILNDIINHYANFDINTFFNRG